MRNLLLAVIAPVVLLGLVPPAGSSPPPGELISVTVSDVANSSHADRLLDDVVGADHALRWENPRFWDDDAYPMVAEFDLGQSVALSRIRYYAGSIDRLGSDRVTWTYSTDATGDDFRPLGVWSGHDWNSWHIEDLDGPVARRVRVSIGSRQERFNITEVELFGLSVDDVTDDDPIDTDPIDTDPIEDDDSIEPDPIEPDPTDTDTTGSPSALKPALPGPGIERVGGWDSWPTGDLSDACIELHNRHWTRGPNPDPTLGPDHAGNKAYLTAHPDVMVHPDTGETCAFPHSHSFTSILPEMLELLGGWPAFGYVAEVAAHGAGTHRHEDHVGHKMTVATFRAAIGNSADTGSNLYDAGFTCHWASMIHQGSWSLDAFANHLHAYHLALRCFDGLNEAGAMDGETVGTEVSMKLLHTFGEPNRYNPLGCGVTMSDSADLVGPDGESGPAAMVTEPVPDQKVNGREFRCARGFEYHPMDTIQQVDLWTQPNEIERDGRGVIFTQPYYIVKNPARVLDATDTVIRTIDLCYTDLGDKRTDLGYCTEAPEAKPDWRSHRSPFNGTLRAVNFKTVDLRNEGGPTTWCTDAFGRSVDDPLPCEPGHLEQYASSFTNHWNDGRYRHNGRQGQVSGSLWAVGPDGSRFEAEAIGGGAYRAPGIGMEFVIDNRNGPDGRIGGQN